MLRDLEQAEVHGLFVRSDVEIAAQVINAVFVIGLTRVKNLELAFRIIRIQHTDLCTERLAADDKDVVARTGLVHIAIELLVGFLKHIHVAVHTGPQFVATDQIGTQRLRILFEVENCGVVVRPFASTGHVFDHVR